MRYRSIRPDDAAVRARLRGLAAERRRFGYRRLLILLRREGVHMNHKKLRRLYRRRTPSGPPAVLPKEKLCLIGPLGPVFDKNHESGVIFDDFCDHFCANRANVPKVVLSGSISLFIAFSNRNMVLQSTANLFSCSHCTTFVFTTFYVSAKISAQILKSCLKTGLSECLSLLSRFQMKTRSVDQEQTCSAVKTEQLLCLHLFTVLRKFLRKNTNKLKRHTFFNIEFRSPTDGTPGKFR